MLDARRHRSVLVVGDDLALRTAIRLNLEGEGVHVMESDSTGKYSPLPIALPRRPDVCILDLRSPAPSEWTKLPALRAWSALRDVPVLVVADEPPDPELSQDCQPDAHLLKPFHAEELVRNVLRMLKRGKR